MPVTVRLRCLPRTAADRESLAIGAARFTPRITSWRLTSQLYSASKREWCLHKRVFVRSPVFRDSVRTVANTLVEVPTDTDPNGHFQFINAAESEFYSDSKRTLAHAAKAI